MNKGLKAESTKPDIGQLEARSLLSKSAIDSTTPEEIIPLTRIKHVSIPPAAISSPKLGRYSALDYSEKKKPLSNRKMKSLKNN
jgi:hypothetical protein